MEERLGHFQEMKIAWLTAHRAIGEQAFRKKELAGWIENIRLVMKKNLGILYKIYVIEQADTKEWNRGALYNAGFQTAATDDHSYLFINCNTDYRIPEESLPDEFFYHNDGFLDLHGYDGGLGSFCAFYADAYEKCNGFPNDFWGWGGEDTAIKKRIEFAGISIHRPQNLYQKWLKENREHPRDFSKNGENIGKAERTTAENMWESGINKLVYEIESVKRYDDVIWVKVQC